MASSTEYARHVIDSGFVGVPWWPINPDETGQPVRDERGHPTYTGERLERCEFRDQPPSGLAFSRTTESRVDFDPDDHTAKVIISGGAVLADDPGDFVLSIEVPEDFARDRQIREEPGRVLDPKTGEVLGDAEPVSWPFREFLAHAGRSESLPQHGQGLRQSGLLIGSPRSGWEVTPFIALRRRPGGISSVTPSADFCEQASPRRQVPAFMHQL